MGIKVCCTHHNITLLAHLILVFIITNLLVQVTRLTSSFASSLNSHSDGEPVALQVILTSVENSWRLISTREHLGLCRNAVKLQQFHFSGIDSPALAVV